MKTLSELKIASTKYRRQIWRYFSTRKRLSAFLEGYNKHELSTILLLSVENAEDLCSLLDVPYQELQGMINCPKYYHYEIEKKKGGKREINAPDSLLKSVQRKLNYYLQAMYLSVKPDEVHGFVINEGERGEQCNIRENAAIHSGKAYVLNTDLKDFFPNISGRQVLHLFSSDLFNYSEEIATALALLTTYQGKLPTGAPTSPVISNLICLDLDAHLKEFAKENNLSYSRYADDLSFSSDELINTVLINKLRAVIKNCGFAINEKKVRMISANKKQTVTGIVVNEKVNVDRQLLKRIRAMIHDLQSKGLESATRKHFAIRGEVDKRYTSMFMSKLKGYINFIGQIRGREDGLYLKFKTIVSANNKYLIQSKIKIMEHQVDFYEKFNSITNSLKLAIISYNEANYQQATQNLDDFFYTNRHLYGEELVIYESLRTLVEYRIG